MKLEFNEYGNFLCPYCEHILTPIFRMWILKVISYICHWCQIKFNIKINGIKTLEEWSK